MTTKEIFSTAKQAAVQKLATILVVGVCSLLVFAYTAWADNRYVQHEQLAQLELNLVVRDITKEIEVLRRQVRSMALDLSMAEQRGDDIARARAESEILFLQDEIAALLEERDALQAAN